MVDSSKFNCYDLHEYGSLEQVHTVVTDAGVSKEALALLERYGVEVVIAQ